MGAVEKYDRWLKNPAIWAPEDDWDPSEYYQWCLRLKDARNNLKETYKKVDEQLLKEARSICEQYDPPERKMGVMNFETVAKMIVRYIIAYNFYTRASFEDLKDNQVVARTQKQLGKLGIGLKDVEVAHMLQNAADKVPLRDAVTRKLDQLTKEVGECLPLAHDWRVKVNTDARTTSAILLEIVHAKSNGALPTVAELPTILDEVQEQRGSSFPDHEVKAVLKTLNSDKQIARFVQMRSDPILSNLAENLANEFKCLQLVMASGKLSDLLDKAVSLEKDNLSWERTIGPAVTAIRRLGKRSAGRNAERLAEYARNHARRPL